MEDGIFTRVPRHHQLVPDSIVVTLRCALSCDWRLGMDQMAHGDQPADLRRRCPATGNFSCYSHRDHSSALAVGVLAGFTAIVFLAGFAVANRRRTTV